MSHSSKKLIAVNFEDQTHHIDHLAPICTIMDMPLLVNYEPHQMMGQRYYPGLQTIYLPSLPTSLIADYDVVFTSFYFNQSQFRQMFGEKAIKHVHCPHGFSDKKYWFQSCVDQDYLLVYGQSMLDMFKEQGLFDMLPPYVMTGNYRYQYFLQHREFYRELVQREIFSFFKEKHSTVLYAPSWRDVKSDTSFFDAIEKIVEKLPDHFNLIVKLHPRLEDNDPANYARIVTRYEHKKNVLFLAHYPLVFPILDQVDIYLGDSSSISYDFLAFNKPLYFLQQEDLGKDKDRALRFQTGIVIEKTEYDQIWKIIQDRLPESQKFSKAREETFYYAFGPTKPLEQIRTEVLEMVEK